MYIDKPVGIKIVSPGASVDVFFQTGARSNPAEPEVA